MHNAIVVLSNISTKANGAENQAIQAIRANQEACLLAVVDSCVCSRSGDVYVSMNCGEDHRYLDKLLAIAARPGTILEIFEDRGGSLEDRLQYAASYILKDGQNERLADSVLLVGGDAPTLQPQIIRAAVRKMLLLSSRTGTRENTPLENGGGEIGKALVVANSMGGGFSLIGFTYSTMHDLGRIINREGAYEGFASMLPRVMEAGIPVGQVEIEPVLDALQLAEKSDSGLVVPRRP